MHKSDIWTRTTSLYWSQTSAVVLCMHNIVISTRIKRLCCFAALTCGFCMLNSDFWTRITNLYGTQTWPVVLCMYIIVLSMRNTSLYWFQTSSVVFACKTAWLAPELIVSMGPSPRVWFLDAKQRLLERNNKSLCVPDTTCRFVHVQQRA